MLRTSAGGADLSVRIAGLDSVPQLQVLVGGGGCSLVLLLVWCVLSPSPLFFLGVFSFLLLLLLLLVGLSACLSRPVSLSLSLCLSLCVFVAAGCCGVGEFLLAQGSCCSAHKLFAGLQDQNVLRSVAVSHSQGLPIRLRSYLLGSEDGWRRRARPESGRKGRN